MQSLQLVDNFIAQFNFVCAYSEEQKRIAYQTRFKQSKEDFDGLTHVEQVIDQYDHNSTHLLLQENSSRQYIACIRISHSVESLSAQPTLPCQRANSCSLGFIDQVFSSGCHLSLCEISRLSINPEYCDTEAKKYSFSEAMYLAAFSLARLRFDDRILLSLPCNEFKRLRARGLQLEQTTNKLNSDSEDLFWLSSESGILDNSPAYDLYQHILGCITHQLNQPLLDGDDLIANEGV
ncbi:hypothetical protein A3740_15835 [Oleiphilus sp. HI0068]|uniref:GNAT family N-acyltransferase n=3 Tax=unclassified Oleiphilus TaxID=2631174 RepID=UPI0007CF1CB2|nr:GNAT family N-acyltransferase [Oleiphilus sp. HI0061]KZY62646.1 hypothetical protein A3735_10125 [Oleiphilus sp. HI0061]KZY75180.1 hypothetical protein A3740_15835 [Oleiphilus sp. HI0068]KZY78054.1 hypothetical protein A3741_08810 [Oleiphilus sp. HI0069]